MKVRVGSKYVFNRAGWDIADPKVKIENGTVVKVGNMRGCPPANTMGHCYVFTLSGEFLGMVSTASLSKPEKKN